MIGRNGVVGVPTILPANGLLLALMLRTPTRLHVIYMLCGVAAYVSAAMFMGLTVDSCLRIATVDFAELLIARSLLWRYMGRRIELSEPETLWRFALYVAILTPAAATALSAVIRLVLGQHLSLSLLVSLFLAHGLGFISFAPLGLSIWSGDRQGVRAVRSGWRVISAAVLVGVSVFVFWQSSYPLLFLVLPPLAGMVVVGGFAGGALGLFLITIIANIFTLYGLGPAQLVSSADLTPKIIVVQIFAATAALLALVLSVVLAERDRAEKALLSVQHGLEKLATLDSLTGLANRRRLDECLDQECRRAQREGVPLCVLLIDVDLFKSFNDQYGHQAGDACLRRIADVLRGFCRRGGDLAARYGGEEFAVVLATDLKGAVFLAESIRSGIARLGIPHAENTAHGKVVTVSIGVASLTTDASRGTPSDLLREADMRLYEAKRHGRDQVQAPPLRPTAPVPPFLAREPRG
ncbi:GGDEF domain-containing protein [Acidocella sp.]|uniref:GGDEF domain-containing protein n=1 Tax=Acidocella sp. TaxID=50710 RepID=UPI003CFF3FEE